MKNSLLGLAIAALLVGSVYAQNCDDGNCCDVRCDTCGDSGCLSSWNVVGGFEALALRPRLPNGEAFIISTATFDDRVRDFDFDYEAAPRLWLGIENCNGLGARARYFYLDANDAQLAFVDAGFTDRVHREISESVFRSRVEVFNVVEEAVAVATDLKLQTLDLEVTQRFERRKTNANVSAGVRWAQSESQLLAGAFDDVGVLTDDYAVRAKFNGWGATMAAGLNRQLGRCGLSLLANARASALMGTSDMGVLDAGTGDFLINDRYAGMFIGEVQVGAQYARMLCNGSEASLRVTYEGQFWTGMPLATRMGPNFSDSDQLFLDGFGIGLGLNF